MNIRLVAVDHNGCEIEDDGGPNQTPVDALRVDSVPRVGEQVLFYNTHGRDFYWTVVGVTWMVSPGEWVNGDGHAHVCIMIRRNGGEGI